jgi:thiol:disulfide interchange protein DsbD
MMRGLYRLNEETEMNGLVSCRNRVRLLSVAAALLLVLGAASPGRAQAPAAKGSATADRISFTVRLDPRDPFSDAYKVGAPQSGPLKVRRGELLRLTITGKVKPGFHTYPLVGLPGSPYVSKLVYTKGSGLEPLWPVQEPEGVTAFEKDIGPVKEFTGEFQWSQDVLVRPDAAQGRQTLKILVDSQVCDENNCVPLRELLETAVEVSDEPAVALPREVESRLKEQPPSYASVRGAQKPPAPAPKTDQAAEPKTGQAPAASGPSPFLPGDEQQYRASMAKLQKEIIVPKTVSAASGTGDSDLLGFILSGIFWGAVSLITPCVFPMIPITVSFFLKQSEKEHHRPITMALVYCATIVLVLTIAAVALLNFFQALSVNAWANYGLGALFIFFALSLFGMYEIELPSGLARFTSEREGKGGMVGTVFMALTFTIISFACVAPFLGGFSGTSATVQRPLWHTILGGVAFSATFAAPFFLLAIFPTLLKKMPKSGSWLNAVKVVMGFLELAAALKFLRAGEIAHSSSVPSFFTYDFVLGLYVALCVLCGAYLLGLYRLPHDTPSESLSVPRLMFSLLFLSLAFYLAPALFSMNAEGERQRPAGTIFAWVDSFLLPEFQGTKGEAWTGNLDYAVARAREHLRRTNQPKRIFIDFTGKLCTNCKINEKSVFSKPEIKRLFQPYELVQLYTDYVPNEFYSPELRARFGSDLTRQRDDAVEVNLPFQQALFNTSQLPLYVILEPRLDNTIVTLGVYPEGRILNEGAFAEFLRRPGPGTGSALAQAPGG